MNVTGINVTKFVKSTYSKKLSNLKKRKKKKVYEPILLHSRNYIFFHPKLYFVLYLSTKLQKYMINPIN